MKKTMMILGFLMGMSRIAFAAEDAREGISQNTLRSFHTDFGSATEVTWSETPTCYKAAFRSGEQVLFAYYDKTKSELVAVTRHLQTVQLPLNLQKGIRERLKGAWMTELFEVAAAGETSYYATVENADQVIVLRSNGATGWDAVSRTMK